MTEYVSRNSVSIDMIHCNGPSARPSIHLSKTVAQNVNDLKWANKPTRQASNLFSAYKLVLTLFEQNRLRIERWFVTGFEFPVSLKFESGLKNLLNSFKDFNWTYVSGTDAQPASACIRLMIP